MNVSNPYGKWFLKQGIQELAQRFVSAILDSGFPSQSDQKYVLSRANAELELIQNFLFVHTGEFSDIAGDLDDAYHLAEILIRMIGYLETAQRLGK